jgi:hypothetical protein
MGSSKYEVEGQISYHTIDLSDRLLSPEEGQLPDTGVERKGNMDSWERESRGSLYQCDTHNAGERQRMSVESS